MAAQYGAHEVMELHEVLTDAIDGINQFELYKPHVTDQQLSSMIDKHINFMTNEYNMMVQALNQQGMAEARPYRAPITSQPIYGLNNPAPQSPHTATGKLNDRDIASGMLGCHKSSAIMKSMAALECADLNLRRMVQQGSINCSEMAYEVWQYMNQNGYYQVPTMKQMTTNTMINTYTPANMGPMNNMNQMGDMDNTNKGILNLGMDLSYNQ
ncbi:spore coat protein [Peptococcaceae bacterium 1198_IL3148]